MFSFPFRFLYFFLYVFRVHKLECKKNVKHFKTKNSLKYKKKKNNNASSKYKFEEAYTASAKFF